MLNTDLQNLASVVFCLPCHSTLFSRAPLGGVLYVKLLNGKLFPAQHNYFQEPPTAPPTTAISYLCWLLGLVRPRDDGYKFNGEINLNMLCPLICHGNRKSEPWRNWTECRDGLSFGLSWKPSAKESPYEISLRIVELLKLHSTHEPTWCTLPFRTWHLCPLRRKEDT